MNNASGLSFGCKDLANNEGFMLIRKNTVNSNLPRPANVTEPRQEEVHGEEVVALAVFGIIIRTNEIQPVQLCSLLGLM